MLSRPLISHLGQHIRYVQRFVAPVGVRRKACCLVRVYRYGYSLPSPCLAQSMGHGSGVRTSRFQAKLRGRRAAGHPCAASFSARQIAASSSPAACRRRAASIQSCVSPMIARRRAMSARNISSRGKASGTLGAVSEWAGGSRGGGSHNSGSTRKRFDGLFPE